MADIGPIPPAVPNLPIRPPPVSPDERDKKRQPPPDEQAPEEESPQPESGPGSDNGDGDDDTPHIDVFV